MRARLAILVALAACRPQALPEAPRDRDAANPRAPAPKPEAPASLTRSAFEGVKVGKGAHGGHHHHHKASAKGGGQ